MGWGGWGGVGWGGGLGAKVNSMLCTAMKSLMTEYSPYVFTDHHSVRITIDRG